MPTAHLPERGTVRVAGDEAKAFLERLITCDTDRIAPGRPRFGALLSPQGKILADFVLHQLGEGVFLLDVARDVAADLVRRLTLYRLRAKIAIEDVSSAHAVQVGWGDAALPDGPVAAVDPRRPELGWRAILDVPPAGAADADAYHAHRIGCAVPEGGRDFAWGDAFPHEALMDQLSGVDFDKGCYVGQEVVSRMQHRGTARTRIVPVLWEGDAPPTGTEIHASDRLLGTAGTSAGTAGLATLRLDRTADALAAGLPLLAAGHGLRLGPKPDWVRFAWPGEAIPA